ncbi:molybdopterin-dependent oxidoreductase [Mucilaginibacter sp. PPCGB 2223]|uniref:molybdopterin-dependent oxidoreductase n=1 Tax=Mucilaginibacter sp. PPCGB 2223 TaxID=1886027 RepID=UPI0009F16B8E|nr:molybdopterin-dependent oxidoreductase [Mucilaginibacter sp. PPCGB 2223]
METPIDPEQNPEPEKPAAKTPEQIAKEQDALLDAQIKRRSFIAFGTFTALGVAAYGSWRWLLKSPDEVAGVTAGAHAPLRRALNKNELFFRKLFYNEKHLVRTYPKEMAAKNVRVNSDEGLKTKFDPAAWVLQVKKKSGEVLKITIDEIRALPKTEIVFDFKCVEGWDQISHWGGLKFSDFIEHFGLQEEAKLEYCGMETPDKQYYVGLDMPSVMHPQTMLAYEVNDKPLPLDHGAPLRLIIPVKYGIKNLKRIGTINFSDQRPRDYWAELGYDYYSGL